MRSFWEVGDALYLHIIDSCSFILLAPTIAFSNPYRLQTLDALAMRCDALRIAKRPLLASAGATQSRCLSYKQGQMVNNVREYFYYVDHQGQLFLDDARIKNFTSCFKGLLVVKCST